MSWVALAVSSGCSRPRSPANPQHDQESGTETSSLMNCAISIRSSLIPSRVDAQVGCTMTESSGRVTVSRGSSSSAANSITSSTGTRQCRTISASDWVQLLASVMIGNWSRITTWSRTLRRITS